MATVADIIAELHRQAHHMDLDRGSLAKDLMDIAVDGVIESMDRQQAPDGTPWDKLKDSYRRWKARKRPGKKIGEFDQVLKARVEVEGRRTVTADEITMIYGVSTEALQHAWFGERREFYGLTQKAVDRTDSYLDRHVRRM